MVREGEVFLVRIWLHLAADAHQADFMRDRPETHSHATLPLGHPDKQAGATSFRSEDKRSLGGPAQSADRQADDRSRVPIRAVPDTSASYYHIVLLEVHQLDRSMRQ